MTILTSDMKSEYTHSFLSWLLGCAFGRWNVQFATGTIPTPEIPDVFSALPICPVGQLQNTQGLPSSQEDLPEDYPISIPWNGILVDDINHELDIEKCVREVIGVLWAGSGDSTNMEKIEQEACEILSVKSLREYYCKPSGFFAEHLMRYSKSRRQAPIYWPISTASGSYTLLVYSQRLTDQTLYTAINDFIEPRQKQIQDDLKSLRSKSARSKVDEIELERLVVFYDELEDFRSQLSRIAKFWKPNLNDGVQITAAPLWQFFQPRKWRDTLKKTWEELEEGKYDWAHLALSLWPERVVRTAHKDRSIAIAHSLEETLWHEVEIKKSSKAGRVTVKYEWQPRELSEKELDTIAQRVKNGELKVTNGENSKS